VGDEVSIDELMDVASEPHKYNIYMVSNYSELRLEVGNQLINALCNSKRLYKTTLQVFLDRCVQEWMSLY